VPGRDLQQIIRRALQRKAAPSDTRDQSDGRHGEQGPGVLCWVRGTGRFGRPTGEPSTGDAQVGSTESHLTDDDRMEQQVERLGERWGGQFPDVVCAAVARDTVVIGMGLRLLERGRQPPVPPTSLARATGTGTSLREQ